MVNYRKIIYSLTVLFIIPVFIFITGQNGHAQTQSGYNKYLYLPMREQPKTFIDLLFEMNDSSFLTRDKSKSGIDQTNEKPSKKVEQDTARKENKIESLRDGGDKFYLYLDLIDREQNIDITVYNMLGKNVLDVYSGPSKPKGVPYEIIVSGPPSLPNGPYLCVVVGKNFRLREKFVVLRR